MVWFVSPPGPRIDVRGYNPVAYARGFIKGGPRSISLVLEPKRLLRRAAVLRAERSGPTRLRKPGFALARGSRWSLEGSSSKESLSPWTTRRRNRLRV